MEGRKLFLATMAVLAVAGAATLTTFTLGLTTQEKGDLVQYLLSI